MELKTDLCPKAETLVLEGELAVRVMSIQPLNGWMTIPSDAQDTDRVRS
jgi:hypothetical protein